jgi:hypothetical protein
MEKTTIEYSTIKRVRNFEIVADYTLHLEFDDGSERIVDFEPILSGPLFGALRDVSLFNQVQLEPNFGTLVWPNGADIDPMVLYDWPQHVKAIMERRQQYSAVSV